MRPFKLLNILLLGAIITSSPAVLAKEKFAKGTYKPVKGWVKTYEISDPSAGEQPEQIGSYEIHLINVDWGEMTPQERRSTKRKLKLTGLLRGKIDSQTFMASHTLADADRSYLIRTADDQLIPVSGDPFCSTGTPMEITERVNLMSATGKYSSMTGGTLVFQGTVNNCPTQPKFGQNDLEVVPHEGEVIFQ